ncbi:hypothetical protein [Catenulispora sp. GP43]|uniref:hypothetical protein n=1 Tax=Catenulispora sp. GP43 TaxID=3156263 RepID=UPI003517FED7
MSVLRWSVADADRMARRLAVLRRCGAWVDKAVVRPGFTEPERRAQRYVAREAVQAGLHAWVDAAGNLLVRRAVGDVGDMRDAGAAAAGHASLVAGQVPGCAAAGRGNHLPGQLASDATGPIPRLILGAHLDTPPGGDRFGGAHGVVAALEVLQVVAESAGDRDLACEPVLVVFANSAGALFPHPGWGAKAVLGSVEREPADRFGTPLRHPLHQAGGDLDALDSAAWPVPPAAWLGIEVDRCGELDGSAGLGIVAGFQGRASFEIRAGARGGPVDLAVSESLAAVAAAEHGSVTLGRLILPSDEVLALVELCDPSPATLAAVQNIAARVGSPVVVRSVLTADPVDADTALAKLLAEAADLQSLPHTPITTRAGGDAQLFAAAVPAVPTGTLLLPATGDRVAGPCLTAAVEVLLQVTRTVVGLR